MTYFIAGFVACLAISKYIQRRRRIRARAMEYALREYQSGYTL